MKDYFKPKTWLIAILMFMAALGFSAALVYYEFGLEKNIKITRASADDNVSGWAWNANTGWISFNSTDCDKNSNGFVDTNIITNGCNGNDNSLTPVKEYGVKIDLNTGYFSGYAWSSNMGWISFNRRTCVGGGEDGKFCAKNNDCSSNSCSLSGPGAAGAPLSAPYNSPASLDYNAIYSFSAKTVTGWAKILSLGDNGWVKFNGDKQDGQPWAPGVTIDPATSEFSGWAWNANSDESGIGWISFNCANDGSCGTSNYKTIGKINHPPTVTNLTAPNWSFQQAGASGALNAYLDWIFSDEDAGSSEKAYQIIVNTQNNRNNPFFDSGICVAFTPGGKCTIAPGAGDQFPLQLALLADGKTLDYNTAYYWWVQVWDNYDATSGWKQFNTNILGHVLTDNQVGNTAKNPIDPNLTFTTYKHKMPEVDFTWFPLKPSRGEEVEFTDASQIYLSSAPSTPIPCDSDNCRWEWSTTTANVDIVAPTASSTIIKFNSAGNATITLKVTDNDDYYISRSETINVNANLPGWKEVKPE